MPKKKENTTIVWVYISDELRTALRKIANKERKSMSEYIRNLIRHDVERNLCDK